MTKCIECGKRIWPWQTTSFYPPYDTHYRCWFSWRYKQFCEELETVEERAKARVEQIKKLTLEEVNGLIARGATISDLLNVGESIEPE